MSDEQMRGWLYDIVDAAATGEMGVGQAADDLLALVKAYAKEVAADQLEAEAAYDDAAGDEQYPRHYFAARLRERADNLRFDAEDGHR